MTHTYTTTSGIDYVVCDGGRGAYPAKGPPLFPADLWDEDCARARGEYVDASLPAGSYTVRAAGACWREVWEWLNARP